jgi:hypothetical protein
MAGVYVPEQKKNSSDKLLTAGGAVAGGVLGAGSPQAIAMGAGLGSTASGLLSSSKQQPGALQSAMKRRMLREEDY